MLRIIAAQVLRRRGRSLAIISAIVVAAVSFSLLTSAVATSRLQVQGTVDANYRTAYDILVRPASSQTPLEDSDQLVQQNYLSGIFGGITLAQYREIAKLANVEVAAPVAMVGYMLPSLYLGVRIDSLVSDRREQLFKVKRTWSADRGLSKYPDRDTYIYVSRAPVDYKKGGVAQREVCLTFDAKRVRATSAFDIDNLTELNCYTTNPPSPGRPFEQIEHGQIGFGIQYIFPVLMAAIDPVAEARLVGLDSAITSGRYLTPDDRTRRHRVRGGSSLTYNQIPVLMATEPLTDDALKIQVQSVDLQDPEDLLERLSRKDAADWLSSQSTRTLRTISMDDKEMYPLLLREYAKPNNLVPTQYWSAGQVTYQQAPNRRLRPAQVRNRDPYVWTDFRMPSGFLAPVASGDRAFRHLQVHTSSNQIIGDTYASPTLRQVGVFEADAIQGFSRLSEVPLTTYYPPAAEPGDEPTRKLLGDRALLPSANLAGYLQQPPMLLTTLRSLPSLTDANAFGATEKSAKAPISVIRIRVAGVTGADSESQERVRLVAEQIARRTGLTVDITIGSSPRPELISLPAGAFGRPELTLREGWVRKGVTVQLLSAIDKKSVALFGLVLLVCVLFLVNATLAAVRTRRSELGTLACLGWPARRIFAMLEIELVVTGLIAGLLGTALAAGLMRAFDVHVSWWQLALITPVATVLAALAGIGPAWSACRTTPLEAIQPAVHAPRRAIKVVSILRLAVVGVARWPGRTALAAASLFVGVGAFAVLIAIQTAFRGGVAGTLLGDVVAVQVRAVDYVAAGLTILLGACAVADIAYLNIRERTSEIGTLRAAGWAESHLRRLFGIEALITAAMGALSGACAGVVSVSILLPVGFADAAGAAAAAVGIGIGTAVLALIVPLGQLSRLAPAAAIAAE